MLAFGGAKKIKHGRLAPFMTNLLAAKTAIKKQILFGRNKST
jgi:hypothetical protein